MVVEEEAKADAEDQQRGGLTLKVVPEREIPAEGADCVNVCVEIGVPEAAAEEAEAVAQAGVDIACIIDTSGSMCSFATREDENGNVVHDGLSILDIVKHAVKTVVHTLGDNDRCLRDLRPSPKPCIHTPSFPRRNA